METQTSHERTAVSDAPRDVTFFAEDGTRLTGSVFAPPPSQTVRGRVVMASAMGVRRRLYRAFASYLAGRGLHVLTFDYRGIGDSRTSPRDFAAATLADWGERDLAAAHAYSREHAGALPLAQIGHSVGGAALALLRGPNVDAALLIAAQSGYHRHWSGVYRPAMGALWRLTPAVVACTGRLPMRALGQGEDVPPNVARQWAEWGRDPRYVGRYLMQRDQTLTSTLACPLRLYAFTDDGYAPVRAVEAMIANFQSAPADLRVVTPASLEVGAIGHFGVFREAIGKTLWREQADWILQKLGSARGAS